MKKLNISHRILLSIIAIFSLACCTKHRPDERLAHIYSDISQSPTQAIETAIAALDSINPEELSEPDRHFYDFLSIKANDKAYVLHRSDSLYLDVERYYSTHDDMNLYPEVLYYGGRVYSDLGDYPTALDYFQRSIELVKSKRIQAPFVYSLHSQTGRLLESMRLYDEAIPYIELALQKARDRKDTVNTIHDLFLLGCTCMNNANYTLAMKHFNEAHSLSNLLPDSAQRIHFQAKAQMHKASTYLLVGKTDTAVILIKDIPYKVKPLVRNTALSRAASIYLQADMLDSAYKSSYLLIHNSDMHSKKRGYQIILNPKLKCFSTTDSLEKYIGDYAELLEKDYDENSKTQSLMQRSAYNYNVHEAKREKAERTNRLLWFSITGAVFTILCLTLIVLWLKYRNNRDKLKLHEAIAKIRELEDSYALKKDTGYTPLNEDDKNSSVKVTDGIDTMDSLRQSKKEKLLSLYSNNETDYTVSPIILQSDAYNRLYKNITKGTPIKETSRIWHELEESVLQVSPEFKANLRLLANGRLTDNDYHTALLIKCGISPTQMAGIFCITKGAIVSRRESLCTKIFGENLGTKVIDGIIRLL